MAHELARVQNRDTLTETVAATFAGAIAMLGSMLSMGGNLWLATKTMKKVAACSAVSPWHSLRQWWRCSFQWPLHVLESISPMRPAHGSVAKPLALANALRKLQMGAQAVPLQQTAPSTARIFIVNPLTSSTMLKLFPTHPPVEERIARLEALVG